MVADICQVQQDKTQTHTVEADAVDNTVTGSEDGRVSGVVDNVDVSVTTHG